MNKVGQEPQGRLDHRLLKVLVRPIISEKAMRLSEKDNCICFQLTPDANKFEVKQVVEFLFGVKVIDVCVVNRKGKQKRFRSRPGYRGDKKIAYIRLHPESKMILDEGVPDGSR